VNVEALLAVAFRPWHDVGGAQECRVSDTGDWAPAAPVIHQGVAKYILADALDDQTLGLGRSGQVGRLGPEARERHVGAG